MQSFIVVLKSLVLALLLTGSALAADKVNINSASAAEIDRVLLNVVPPRHRRSSTTGRHTGHSKASRTWRW